jgi:hypothetical protein
MCALTRYDQTIDDDECQMFSLEITIKMKIHTLRRREVEYALANCITTLRMRHRPVNFSMNYKFPDLKAIKPLTMHHFNQWCGGDTYERYFGSDDVDKMSLADHIDDVEALDACLRSKAEEDKMLRETSLIKVESKITKLLYGDTKPDSTTEMY